MQKFSRIASREEQAVDAFIQHSELCHRIGNQFQILSSIAQSKSRTPEQALEKLDNHLSAFIGLYQLLGRPPAEEWQAADYIANMCMHLSAGCFSNGGIVLHAVVDCPHLPTETCRKICLVIHELVLNSSKHAFVARSGGNVHVRVRVRPPRWSVVVADDGCGIERSLGTEGHGLAIVLNLIGTGGRVCIRSGARGTCYKIISSDAKDD